MIRNCAGWLTLLKSKLEACNLQKLGQYHRNFTAKYPCNAEVIATDWNNTFEK